MRHKFLLPLLALLLLTPSVLWAVDESCVVVAQTDTRGESWSVYDGDIILKCTAASDDASMSVTAGAEGASQLMGLLDGCWVTEISSYDGAGTDPTASSDLSITDSIGRVIVSPTVNGLNVITNGTDSSFYVLGPDGNAGNYKAAKSRPWTVAWSNNVVNSGINFLRISVTGTRNVK